MNKDQGLETRGYEDSVGNGDECGPETRVVLGRYGVVHVDGTETRTERETGTRGLTSRAPGVNEVRLVPLPLSLCLT